MLMWSCSFAHARTVGTTTAAAQEHQDSVLERLNEHNTMTTQFLTMSDVNGTCDLLSK